MNPLQIVGVVVSVVGLFSMFGLGAGGLVIMLVGLLLFAGGRMQSSAK